MRRRASSPSLLLQRPSKCYHQMSDHHSYRTCSDLLDLSDSMRTYKAESRSRESLASAPFDLLVLDDTSCERACAFRLELSSIESSRARCIPLLQDLEASPRLICRSDSKASSKNRRLESMASLPAQCKGRWPPKYVAQKGT